MGNESEDWLAPLEQKLQEALMGALRGKLPEVQWGGREEFWKKMGSLHDLLLKNYNPLNLDLPGNPRDPMRGEVDYPYPEVYQRRYGRPYVPSK